MERHNQSRRKPLQKVIFASSIVLFLFFLLVSAVLLGNVNMDENNKIDETLTANTIMSNTKSSHIVIEAESGRILSGDNVDARLPMASTTKIMTALVAIDSDKLGERITIEPNMTNIEGSSIYLKVGEVLTIEELLYGLMLRSGNDSAVAIAHGVAGNVEKFVRLMNEKALSLGLQNTHFVNPHGLHDPMHYTSSRDLAIIAKTAMKSDKFREIVSSKSHIIGGDTSDKRYLVNKNKLLRMYEGGNGIKTGYTKNAGRCLVSSANRNGMQLISVVLNEPDMWNYSMHQMDEVFNEYHLIKIASNNKCIDTISKNGKRYKVCTHEDIYYPIKEEEREKLTYEIQVDKTKINNKIGENIGKLLVYNDKHLIFDTKIYTM